MPTGQTRASTGQALTAAFYFWFALGVGLASGILEALILRGQQALLHRLVFTGQSTLWMAPLADGIIFGLAGLAAWLVLRLRRSQGLESLATGIPIFLAAFGLLLMVPRVHRVAILLLSLGIAVQGARWLRPRLDRWNAALRRTALILVAAVLTLAVGYEGWRAAAERRAESRLPRPAGATNVLLIMLDTVRALELSLYGYSRPTTPALDAWARGGLVFERALSTAPWTLASHASVMTGRLPHELSANWLSPLDHTFPTLAERLTAAGYLTAGFVANTEYCSAETGLARGFLHYEDYGITPLEALRSVTLGRMLLGSRTLRRLIGNEEIVGRKSVDDVNGALLRWLASRGTRPFFAFLNYYDAHAPYLPPREFAERFGPTEPRRNVRLGLQESWSPDDIRLQRNAYDASIASLDAGLGRLFAELDRRGLLRNTLVILTSDHGEEFYEHRVMGHGNSLYLPSVQVPLVLALPGRVPADARRTQPVSLRDIPATVIDLLGLAGADGLPGRSLSRFFADSASATGSDTLVSEVRFASGLLPHYPAGKGDMHSIVLGGKRYIQNLGDGREEVYDFNGDPAEQHDLAGSPDSATLLAGLREAMRQILGSGAGTRR